MLEEDIKYRRRLMAQYKKDVDPLFRYRSWLEEKRGQQVSSTYSGDDLASHSIPVPVYDGTLLGFVKEVQKGSLLDRNYVYVYTRYRMKTPKDERETVAKVTIRNMEVLTGVLSKYVYGGMTKGYLWPQAVEEGIFLAILEKFKELFDLWDQPAGNQGVQE